ncbi:uncharacterized protein [Blastocystis hominis]|uniref:S1 motif domain-containing protein n=1 Tax=Blastocystis hominis TaxID=12968 RepID=D8MBI4_BLAHO|nr:uncharacterized protein [Blastocystis hominis]CBK25423.2 unnamed protein product [Blastocystis hominis]|eukprot:XP_012899471.1 uncharacterized protein [Blastocystis hominis]
MVKVTQITDIGIYVNLLEYNDIQGFIPASELSRRRIRSIPKLVQVGKVEPSMVTRVDKVKGYIDLSKRRVADDDMKEAEKRYKEAKKVHNIAGILSNRCKISIDTVYESIIWPLSAKYQSAYNAFLLSVSNPEILNDLSVDPPVIAELVSLINARMSPQAKKVRSDIEVTCFSIHGVDGIRAAMVKNRSEFDRRPLRKPWERAKCL